MRYRLVRLLAVLAIAAATVFAVACGDDDGGSADTSTSGGSTQSADTSRLTPKTIGYLDIFNQGPIQQRFYNAFQYGAEHVGWDVQLQDAASVADDALSAARTFSSQNVDAIVASSIPSEWIRPASVEIRGKDIPLINLTSEGTPGVYDAQILEEERVFTELLARRIQEDFPEGTEVGVVSIPVPACQQRAEFLRAALEGTNTPVTAFVEKAIDPTLTSKTVTDMLNANPRIGAFVFTSSTDPQYGLAGLRSAGNREAKVYSYYADSVNTPLMIRNEQFVAVADSDIAKVSFMAIGDLLRTFNGGGLDSEPQFPEVTPVIVTREDAVAQRDQLMRNEGPVSFEELSAPYFEEWQTEYGLGGS